jgi:tetratricopeptide (TPR) repeat protein
MIKIEYILREDGMKRTAFAILFLLIATSFIFAQSYRGQGRIRGVVTDQDGKPLEGVRVKLFSLKGQSGLEVVTNAAGEWIASYVRGGGWNIDFEKAGYAPQSISTQFPEITKNPPIETKLQKVEGIAITDELTAALKEGNRLFEEKKYQEAIAEYESLLAKTPDIYVIYKNIGNCWFELQDYEKAEEAYKKVLEMEPANYDIMLLIGNCYANRGETDKAMEWYAKIEFEKITDQMVLYNIGTSFTKQSKLEDALKYYKKAVELQADFLDAIYQLGLTYLALGNNPEAVAAFENYLKYDCESERAGQVKGFIEFLKKK